MDIPLDILLGDKPAWKPYNVWGQNTDVDIGAVETVWSEGGLYSYPSSAELHDVKSSVVTDNSTGVGARTIRIKGLDENYKEIEEDVVMNGTTVVSTANSYLRINTVEVLTAGTKKSNEGNITVDNSVGGATTAAIPAKAGQSQSTVRTIPAGKKGYITRFYSGLISASTGTFRTRLVTITNGGVRKRHTTIGGNATGTSMPEHRYDFPLEVAEKTDIELRASVDTNDTNLSGGYDMLVVTT